MKKSKFTEAQIVFALKQSETGVRVPEICRKLGIRENVRLNQIVADLSLDKQMPTGCDQKSFKAGSKGGVGSFLIRKLPFLYP